MPEVKFTCFDCGGSTLLAHPTDPKRTFCPKHCPDHNHVYDSQVEWATCEFCGQEAPSDYFDESPDELTEGEEYGFAIWP